MSDHQPVCGNCGKSVTASDITCPHCDALLAAYTSPQGSSTSYVYDPVASVPQTSATADTRVPAPAAPIGIGESAEARSSAPRPLFDTYLTVEDIARAAENEEEESLVVVSENAAATADSFAIPDYARPPADADPIPLLQDGEAEAIAHAEQPAPHASARRMGMPASNTSLKNAPSPPPADRGESWLYDLSRNAPAPSPARPPRERKDRPEPARTTTLPPSDQGERGRTENYLRKLHEQSGYDGNVARRSQPVGTRTPWSPSHLPPANRAGQHAPPETVRRGISWILVVFLILMWVGVVGGIVAGNLNPGLLVLTIALTLLALFFARPTPTTRHR